MALVGGTTGSIQEAIDQLMGREYPAGTCWQYVLDLLHAGGQGDYRDHPAQAVAQTREVWFCDDSRDPWSLIQPWDWLLLTHTGRPEHGAVVGHIGVVIDASCMTHVRVQGGVCREPLRRWRHRLIQLARFLPQGEERS